MEFTNSEIIYLSGTFGGVLPLVSDFIQRESQSKLERAQLDFTFWLVKLIIIPVCAFILTFFAFSSFNITTWYAALYLGATFPLFAQKIVTLQPQQFKTINDA